MISNIFGYIIPILILLGILIFVHEWGHFIMCRLVGVRVDKFSLGFGKKIWGFTRNHTEYLIAWIPLGGYVKMAGEEPCDDKRPEAWEYYGKKPLQKTLILIGGVLMNMILAIAIFFMLFLVKGQPVLEDGAAIITTKFERVMGGSPAEKAGLMPGDRITAVDGHEVDRWDEMVKIVSGLAGTKASFAIQRNDQIIHLEITPKGEPVRDEKTGEELIVGRIGIAAPEVIYEDVGIIQAITASLHQTWIITKTLYSFIGKLVMGQISTKHLGGPILIAELAGDAAKYGFDSFFELVALISINLAVINFLPIPVLDGGHMIFVLVEAIRKKPVSVKVLENAQKIGFAFLIALMVMVFYNDIERIAVRFGWFQKSNSQQEFVVEPTQ